MLFSLAAKPIVDLIRVTKASESTPGNIQIKAASHVDRSSANTARTLSKQICQLRVRMCTGSVPGLGSLVKSSTSFAQFQSL